MDDAQRLTLRTHIQANATVLAFAGGSMSISAKFAAGFGGGDARLIADWYNLTAAPDYWIARTDAPVVDIRDAILWSRMTPAPAITGANAAQANAASNYCMVKQGNLQLLIPATAGTFDATKPSQTAGLKDALTALPSAGSFANQDAGWTGAGSVANVLVRKARNVEKVFLLNAGVPALNDGSSVRGAWTVATGLGNPDTTSFQGTTSEDEIGIIKGLPA